MNHDSGTRSVAENFADRFLQAAAARGAPCAVALDPVFTSLPAAAAQASAESRDARAELDAIVQFSRRVLNVIAPIVPAVKINSAYFERYHADGIAAYDRLVAAASTLGLLVIGDVKRGDVGHTAEKYAAAHLCDAGCSAGSAGALAPDAITISGYFGLDGAAPFMDIARERGKGVFVLVRTSNKSAAAIQDVVTQDGRKVHEIVAAEVAGWAGGESMIGRAGYSCVGAVVATRDSKDAIRLRAAMPKSLFLVPGFGAQGGRAEDFLPYFDASGRGAMIAAGRSVIFAHAEPKYRSQFGNNWERCVEQACRDFAADIRRVIPGLK